MVSVKSLGVLVGAIASVVAQTQLRYMPFGDSITEITCWRRLLYQQLQTAGYTNIDFVGSGTQATSECAGTDYDRDNEGHSGFEAVNIVAQNQLVGWLQQNPADIITMHLGTNDIVYGQSTSSTITALGTLIDQMRASNPNMRIIVAQIIPFTYGDSGVQALNAAIPALVSSKNSTASPIYLVDQHTGMTSSDLRDGVHPNASGDQKMVAKWYPAMIQAIQSIQGSETTKRGVEFVA